MKQKYFRNIFIFILIVFFNSAVFSADDTNIVFKWSFLKKAPNGTIESIDFNKDVTFNKDDQLKITINPIKNAYFYLYYVDNNNELNILFPDNFDAPYKMDVIYNIPGNKEDWFVFDAQKGIDRFYMLVSYNRLTKLEKLSKEYQKLVTNKSNTDKINNAKKDLLDEILNLRANYSKFKVFAEKPTSIAGVSRGIGGDSKDTMIYVEADKFYGKIFRINH
jgi:Domain of unknown function (DUF4384)